MWHQWRQHDTRDCHGSKGKHPVNSLLHTQTKQIGCHWLSYSKLASICIQLQVSAAWADTSPSPPLDNIRVMVIVWTLRGNSIRTALCWIVWYNVHSLQQTYMSSSYRSNRVGLSHWDPYTVHRGGCLELYYCKMVVWFWWDSSLISTANWFPSVFWHCWFGYLACKNCPRNDLLCVEWDTKTLHTHTQADTENWWITEKTRGLAVIKVTNINKQWRHFSRRYEQHCNN